MTIIVYEVKSPYTTTLFATDEGAQNYRRFILNAQGLAIQSVPNHHALNHDNVIVLPRLVVDYCPNPELFIAAGEVKS